MKYLVSIVLCIACLGAVKMPNGAKQSYLLMTPIIKSPILTPASIINPITVTILSTNGSCFTYTESDAGTDNFTWCPRITTNISFQVLTAGISYRPAFIQSSTDMKSWTVIFTTNSDSDFTVTLPALKQKEFFRLSI